MAYFENKGWWWKCQTIPFKRSPLNPLKCTQCFHCKKKCLGLTPYSINNSMMLTQPKNGVVRGNWIHALPKWQHSMLCCIYEGHGEIYLHVRQHISVTKCPYEVVKLILIGWRYVLITTRSQYTDNQWIRTAMHYVMLHVSHSQSFLQCLCLHTCRKQVLYYNETHGRTLHT